MDNLMEVMELCYQVQLEGMRRGKAEDRQRVRKMLHRTASNFSKMNRGVDLTGAEPNNSDNRIERVDLYAKVDEALLGGDVSYLSQPLTPEKEDALQALAVANLRAALMSKNSLLSLKADMLGEESSLLFEYLPKGTHSLSWAGTQLNNSRDECNGKMEAPPLLLVSSQLATQISTSIITISDNVSKISRNS
ncbi:hypothetical protein E2320_009498 [Naja naja]|nr:hypothetical protein E2320_009498 [Naja naja]